MEDDMSNDKKPAGNLALALLAQERSQDRSRLLGTLATLTQTADAIREAVETDSDREMHWWSDHTQGLVYDANRVESMLNRLLVWKRAEKLLHDVEANRSDIDVESAYAVLDAAESETARGTRLHGAATALARSVLDANGVDVASSASSQHFIDTGRYLPKEDG